MFGIYWNKAIQIGRKKQDLHSQHLSNAILGVICNGTTRLSDKETNLKAEFQNLIHPKKEHNHRFGTVNYLHPQNNLLANQGKGISHSISHRDSLVIKRSVAIEHPLLKSNFDTEDYSSGKIMLACTEEIQAQTPFLHTNALRDATYSMVSEGDIKKVNLLIRLTGFVDWLDANNPELLNSDNHVDAEYLFFWLVKCIQDNNGDVLSGLNKGLSMLNKYNVGGNCNILFSDGVGIYAYSNTSKNATNVRKISYKINRNVHNICSYVIKNCTETPGLDWTDVKEHNLYYFPTHGAIQVYANIDTNQYSDTKFKSGVNWACLSLLSC